MAGSAAVLYHLSYKDPPIGTQDFFQIKPGLFAIFEIAVNTATITSSFKVSIMIMIMIMMMIVIIIIIIIIIIIT